MIFFLISIKQLFKVKIVVLKLKNGNLRKTLFHLKNYRKNLQSILLQ